MGSVSEAFSLARVILSGDELASRLNVCRRTVMRWRATGEGPAFIRIGSRRVGYRLDEIERWEASRTFQHRAAEISKSIAAKSAA